METKEKSIGVKSTNVRRGELSLERENYLNQLVAIHDGDAESLHHKFVELSDIFEGLTTIVDLRIEDIMDRMNWAYRSYVDNHKSGVKEVIRDYGYIYRTMLILSRHNDLIHALNLYFDETAEDLEEIM